ncbi:hypothetical protein D3C85_1286730 [compost metagenome]
MPVRLQRLGPGLQAAVGQGDVCGDDDVAGDGALGDPVVGHVGAGVDHHLFDQGLARDIDPGVRHYEDLEAVAAGHAIDLLLHGAGVGVDVEGGGHGGFMARWASREKAGVFPPHASGGGAAAQPARRRGRRRRRPVRRLNHPMLSRPLHHFVVPLPTKWGGKKKRRDLSIAALTSLPAKKSFTAGKPPASHPRRRCGSDRAARGCGPEAAAPRRR